MILVTLVAALMILAPMVFAAPEKITLSTGESLVTALDEIADNGTIEVEGTVVVTEALGIHGKTVTITGGTLDFSSFNSVTLGDHITFDNITLTFTEDIHLYANGYKVTMGEGVTMTNPIKIFGGKNGGTAASTDLTLRGGEYSEIYGGSYNGNIIGDTHLYVGGNTNASVNAANHSGAACVFDGNYISSGHTQAIGGTAYTEFSDSAKANYIFGANNGNGMIYGGVNMEISGGSAMSIYGASRNGGYSGDVKLEISGGTITRRVYGGCYNEYDGSWKHSRYVVGEIVLTLHSGANITFSQNIDRSLYAHSRHATVSDTEVSHLVFADSTAYSNYKNKVKAQDSAMKSIMSGVSAADYVHYHTYTASGAVITQNCIDGNCSASATVAVEGTPIYNGTPVAPAKVIYSGNWYGGELDVSYAGNDQVGTGTASITCGGATAAVNFAITAPKLRMNGEGYGSLEEAVAAAGKTTDADTITLLEDVEIASWMVIGTDVTITADKEVTITAADTQTGGMFRIIDGTLTIEGTSKDAKITLAAGKNTAHMISNNGGNVVLTNVRLVGNENTTHQQNNKVCGIFNYKGTTTAKSVDVVDMVKGDGIYVVDGTTVNLDDVTVSGSGRYGIKVKGILNITNTIDKDHALTVSGSADHAIDVENGGEVTCDAKNAVRFSDNAKKDINVRDGGNSALSCESEEN